MRVLIMAALAALALSLAPAIATAEAQGPRTITVGTQPDFPPFNYAGEDGELTGYDIELVRKIFAKYPEYKLEFLPSSWDGIVLGLESNKSQVIADNMTWSEERDQRYHLSRPYYNILIYLIVKKGRTDIKSLEDLYGKTLELVVGTTPALALERWNEEHGGKIKLQYTKATTYSDPIRDVAEGRADAAAENIVNFNRIIKDTNLAAQAVGEPVLELPVVFLFRRDELGAELKAKFDAAIEGFIKDGTLAALAKEWTGSDQNVPR